MNRPAQQELNKREIQTTFKITRATQENEERVIEGYFALFENETELFPGVFEIITKGAFTNTLTNDIRALWNHNTQYVLARNKSGTLEITEDDKGLYGVIKMPNTQYANDVYELVQRGDVDQCSFGFNIIGEDLEELADGGLRWRINEADLHEISVVTFPAYENTTVKARARQVEEMKQRKLDAKKLLLEKRLGVFKDVKAVKNQ